MQQKKAIKTVDWSLSQVWNEVAKKSDRPLQKRDYIYASEVSGAYCDRFLKMRATAPTNPPNDRSLRKFLCGNLFEFIVKQILLVSGFYIADEVKVDATPYSDTLDVHGRMDFKTVSGMIDVPVALDRVKGLAFPDYLISIGENIIKSLEGVPLTENILELKSISSFGFERVLTHDEAIPGHTLQAYHYQRNGGIPSKIIYLCRDDLRMKEFNVDAEAAEPLYRQDLVEMTDWFRKGKRPPVEPLVAFDEISARFSKNLKVEWSNYLTLLYGFETPEDYRNSVKYVDKWNRALGRYVLAETGALTPTGKKIEITAKNKEVRAEIEKAGYNMQHLIDLKVLAGVSEEEEVETA